MFKAFVFCKGKDTLSKADLLNMQNSNIVCRSERLLLQKVIKGKRFYNKHFCT